MTEEIAECNRPRRPSTPNAGPGRALGTKNLYALARRRPAGSSLGRPPPISGVLAYTGFYHAFWLCVDAAH